MKRWHNLQPILSNALSLWDFILTWNWTKLYAEDKD